MIFSIFFRIHVRARAWSRDNTQIYNKQITCCQRLRGQRLLLLRNVLLGHQKTFQNPLTTLAHICLQFCVNLFTVSYRNIGGNIQINVQIEFHAFIISIIANRNQSISLFITNDASVAYSEVRTQFFRPQDQCPQPSLKSGTFCVLQMRVPTHQSIIVETFALVFRKRWPNIDVPDPRRHEFISVIIIDSVLVSYM